MMHAHLSVCLLAGSHRHSLALALALSKRCRIAASKS
jgi:hypothetical protein